MGQTAPGRRACGTRQRLLLPAIAITIYLGFVVAGCSDTPASQGETSPHELSFAATTELEKHPANNTVKRLSGDNLSADLEGADALFVTLQVQGKFGELAKRFVAAYARQFLLSDPVNELLVRSAETDALGMTHVRLDQTFAGLRLLDNELSVHLDAAQHVTAVQGAYSPTPTGLNLQPEKNSAQAASAAAAEVPGMAADCAGCMTKLVIFAPLGKKPRLAYAVQVAMNSINSWLVVIDATTLQLLEKTPAAYSGGAW